ncbi:alpha/beta hydrolase [Rhizobium ruizarguesonis]|uniref:alpha/beta hydrolase n=1 Tax=Rhizobium ruizarguesonis TaxID=2081791 RepID=UPI0013EEC4A5|nr:alpha/beta hydrolase [Rhizobium ruizarguesonis]
MGALESPSWFRFEFKPDPRKHIVLHEVATLEEELFFEEVARSIAQSPAHETFVFVHGFNVSFQDAVKRTAQIAFDLDFKGAPITYSWPSNGRVLDYNKDEANVIWTVPHLERFLDLLLARSGAERLHVIAHSMGNRAVCDALERRSRITTEAQQNRIHHLVLTAPDIDADTFKELAANIRKTAETVTLYASSNDKAIRLSAEIHGNPRAGTPLLIIPGVETIDASNVDTDFLGHSYFSSARSVLSDIYALFGDDHPASQRLSALSSSGETYYVIKP